MKATELAFLAVVALGLGLLAARTSSGGYQSPEHRQLIGSTVELMQPLKFSPGTTRRYIQYGETMRWQHVNQWPSITVSD